VPGVRRQFNGWVLGVPFFRLGGRQDVCNGFGKLRSLISAAGDERLQVWNSYLCGEFSPAA
jgi:hypothetical protein